MPFVLAPAPSGSDHRDMDIFVRILSSIPAIIGVALIIAALIKWFAAKPEESRVRRAIETNLVKDNLPNRPLAILIAGIVFILLTVLLFYLLSASGGWGAGRNTAW